jgi:hypothetical protein
MVERKRKWKKKYAEESKREKRLTWRNKEENVIMDRKRRRRSRISERTVHGEGGETKNEDWSRRRKERKKKEEKDRKG